MPAIFFLASSLDLNLPVPFLDFAHVASGPCCPEYFNPCPI